MIPNAIRAFNFDLGETADAIRETVRDFAQDKIAPRADEIDRTQPVSRAICGRRWARSACTASRSRRSTAARGSAISSTCVAMEEVSRASASVGLSYGAHSNLCVNQIRRNGTDGAEAPLPAEADLRRACRRARHVGAGRRLRRRLDAHPRREEGRPLRPQRHQDVDHQRARSPRRSSSTPRPIRRPARAASRPSSIEKGFKGFSTAQKLDKLGMRGSDTCELVFEDCEVPEENVLGAGRQAASTC